MVIAKLENKTFGWNLLPKDLNFTYKYKRIVEQKVGNK